MSYTPRPLYPNPGGRPPSGPALPPPTLPPRSSASRPSTPSEPKPKRKNRLRRALIILGVSIIALPILVLGGLWMWAMLLETEVPDLYELRNPSMHLASIAYAETGEEIGRYHDENRTWVGYDRISQNATNALVATEDFRFFEHNGVDWRRLSSSIWLTLQGDPQGGSTITMQLARNLFPGVGRDDSIERKLREIMTARRLEEAYSKTEIIEMYLNTVPFGYNAFGIEAASQVYFGKAAAELSPPEAALLIGTLKATTYYNPVRNPEESRQRRATVLGQMGKYGYLDPSQVAAFSESPLGLNFSTPDPANSPAPYFADFVEQWVQAWAEANNRDLYTGGLRIFTTLDMRLQDVAQRAVDVEGEQLHRVAAYEWSRRSSGLLSQSTSAYPKAGTFPYFWQRHPEALDRALRQTTRYSALRDEGESQSQALLMLKADNAFVDSIKATTARLEASFVAIEPETGYVRAYVGGRDYRVSQFDRASQSRRQPGSTFKPFVYAAALNWGYAPDDRVLDAVRSYGSWRPANSGGGASGAAVTLRSGLTYSKNTISAALIDQIGAGEVVRTAQQAGITSPLQAVPSLALGTSEVTLLEMVGAYGTLASSGIRRTPVIVTRIEDSDGNVLAQFGPQQQRALPASTSYAVLDMMRDVVDKGTAQRLRSMGVRGDVAGKTGTTQESADGWFIAAHPDLVMGAWVGFDDRRLSFRTSYWGQGGHNALFVVGDFARDVQRSGLSLDPDARFQAPPGYQERAADRARWNDDVRLAMDSLDVQSERLVGDTLRLHSDSSRAFANRSGTARLPSDSSRTFGERTGTIRYRDDATATPTQPASATQTPTPSSPPAASTPAPSPQPSPTALPARVEPKPVDPAPTSAPAPTPQPVPVRTPTAKPESTNVPPPPPSRRGSSRGGGGNGGG